ncbi:hypothetical protein [Pedobacter sandarakinus]|uniref:hypothetical protein n=1 Tax=Pedobacter sandarakinus TaxID=353156 RepID=UPI0022468A57|nr:hypothetical protein [Pedobacter sandarakinus]
METNPENQPQKNLSNADETPLSRKHIYKFILDPFSFESSHHFNKIHKRRFNSFGCIHELGKLPGAMF